ncbi:hypothetical protein JCM12298_00300 [Desulfothermus naphthae]
MIKIIGLGQNFLDIPPSYVKIIENADILIGGARQLSPFNYINCQKLKIVPPIDKLIAKIKTLKDKNVVVLADGDPLFFGIGERLIRELGRDIVEIYPNVSVVQRAGARLGLSLKDIYVVSLHGRDNMFDLFSAISWNRYVGVFTDKSHTPAKIAKILLDRDILNFKFHIFEDLCLSSERVLSLSIKDVLNLDYSSLNFLILEREKDPEISPYLGMDDSLFFTDKKQLTKKEVRVISLSNMQIREDSIILDIGAGSGTVSIEALTLAKKGRVYAIEKDPRRAEIIRLNRKRFGVYALEVIENNAEDIIESLPRPDRIFIGGGLINNPELLNLSYERLKSGGIIVVNTVLFNSFYRCISFCKKNKVHFEVIQMNINRAKELSESFYFVPINPVIIITIFKREVD